MTPVGTMAGLSAGDHACLLFAGERERWAALATFVRDGLACGEQVLYVADAPVATVIDALAAAGLEAEAELEDGQLQVRSAGDVYLAGGTFSPERVIELIRMAARGARAAGWDGMRLTGEMGWALSGAPGCELLGDYEREVDAALRDEGVLGVCQYDRRRFAPDALHDARCAHGAILSLPRSGALAGELLDIAVEAPGRLSLSGELDCANADRLAAALVGAADPGGVRVDVSRLAFVDVAGMRALHDAAARLARSGGTLTLVSPPPVVERVLEAISLGPVLRVEPAHD